MVYKITITPDGNCFFRSLSEFLYNTEEKYNIIRMVIYMYAKCNVDVISEFQPNVEIKRNNYIDTATYINNMGKDKYWAGDLEMQLACFIFGIKIAIYNNENNANEYYIQKEDNETTEKYYFINLIILSNNEKDKIPIMVLNQKNENHYELLYFKNHKDINKQKKNNGLKKLSNKNIIKVIV